MTTSNLEKIEHRYMKDYITEVQLIKYAKFGEITYEQVRELQAKKKMQEVV